MSSRRNWKEAEGSTSEFLICPFSLPPFEGNFLGLGLGFFFFFLLVTFSNLFITDFCAFILVCFPEAGRPSIGLMGSYTVLDVSFTSTEPGIPVADVEFCLADGNSGHGVLHAPPGLN